MGNLVSTPPVVAGPETDGFQVLWGVNRLSRGWVEVRLAGEEAVRVYQEDGRGFVPHGDEFIRVRVSGLPMGGLVSVRTVTEAMEGLEERSVSPWEEVRLLNPQASQLHFAVWSDTHDNHALLRALDKATPRPLDFLVWNGDTCPNMWEEKDAFVPTLLNPAGTHFTEGRPAFLLPGNHDLRGRWAYRFPEFSFQGPGRFHHAFRAGPVGFIMLNTGEDKDDDHPTFHGRVACEAVRREQADWLREVIHQPGIADAPYRMVICHTPLRWDPEEPPRDYDRWSERSWRLWKDSLSDWGTQLVISGHTHASRYFPADADYSYAQLTIGSSVLDEATFLEVKADSDTCQLYVRKLGAEYADPAQRYNLSPA